MGEFYKEDDNGNWIEVSPGEVGKKKGDPVKTLDDVRAWIDGAQKRKERFDAWQRERTLTTVDEMRLVHLFRQLSDEDKLWLQIEAFKRWEVHNTTATLSN